MKFRYLPATVTIPIPSLGGGLTRPRPIIAARIIGNTGAQLIDGLLDTGSDDTVLEDRSRQLSAWILRRRFIATSAWWAEFNRCWSSMKKCICELRMDRRKFTNGPLSSDSHRQNCATRCSATPGSFSFSIQTFAATIAK